MNADMNVWAVLVAFLGAGGFAGAIINYVKDRKKDQATAKLSDIDALTRIIDYLRKENNTLQEDYERSEIQNRKMRDKIYELEEKVQNLTANCEQVRRELKAYIEGELTDDKFP